MSHIQALPYIELDSLYLIPVFPGRLSGAVMVRRALEMLSIGTDDAIAVARPPGIEDPFRSAIRKLPGSTLIHIFDPTEPSDVGKELVSVTPCDGFAEAVYFSMNIGSLSIDTYFIDLDISPLLQHDRPKCGDEILGVDDWSFLKIGAEAAVDLYHDHPALRLRRILPVDDWREKHMAGMLQRLNPRYRRTVVILGLENVKGVQQALHQPLSLVEVPEFVGVHERYRPKTSVLLHLLDDYPKVVERFWQCNAGDDFLSFDKMTCVLEEIIGLACLDGSRWSIRNHRAFIQMLDGVMRQKGRRSLPLADALDLVASCYDDQFVKEVRKHLLTFDEEGACAKDVTNAYEQRRPEHVETAKQHNSSLRDSQDDERVVVRGACSSSPNFDVFKESSNLRFNPGLIWPGWSDLHNEMRRRVVCISLNRALATSSERYRGTLGRGLDIRRIVRAMHRKDPSLYVRRWHKLDAFAISTQGVIPILWFFESPSNQWQNCSFDRTWNAHDDPKNWEKKYLVGQTWGDTKYIASPNWPIDHSRISLKRCSFMYSFVDIGMTQSEIEQKHGMEAKRLPREEISGDANTILRSIVDVGSSYVCCVTPNHESAPSVLSSYVKETNKNLIVLTHAEVGTADMQKLSLEIAVDNQGLPVTRGNVLEAQQLYESFVAKFWGS